MSDNSKLSSFVSTAESLTGHPVVFAGNETLHDYAGMNPEAAKIMGWPDKTDAIIIDKNQTVEEQIHDVIHETVEESEIRQGLSYHDAHVIALKAENEITTPEQLVERVEKIKKSEDGKKMADKADAMSIYKRETARAEKEYTRVLRETGDYKKAFAAENTIVTKAQNEYEGSGGAAYLGKSVSQLVRDDRIEPADWKNNKRPNLDNVVELHPSNGSWRNFLKDAELRETKNGIKHYISGNGHYIVLPDGEVITFYGYRGQAAFEEIAKDKDGWLKRRAVAEHEMDELLHTTAKSEKSEPISISATDASEAGKELSTYGHQKVKYSVGSHKGKGSRKSQHTSTGLGSVR